MAKRTTHRSLTGTKLYAVRDGDGKFKDIQTFKRAHAADLRRSSADEMSAGVAKKSTKKAAKKSSKKVAKKASAKKAGTRRKSSTRAR